MKEKIQEAKIESIMYTNEKFIVLIRKIETLEARVTQLETK